MRVPRAIIPTPSEMGLPLEARLASLWQRNAGGVREQFPDFAAFRARFGHKVKLEDFEGASCAN